LHLRFAGREVVACLGRFRFDRQGLFQVFETVAPGFHEDEGGAGTDEIADLRPPIPEHRRLDQRLADLLFGGGEVALQEGNEPKLAGGSALPSLVFCLSCEVMDLFPCAAGEGLS
jgi:hypothetical protein